MKKFIPRWRTMAWVLVIGCGAILAWAMGGASSAESHCNHAYQGTCDAGTTIGVGIVLFIGFIGFVFFSLISLMSRPKSLDEDRSQLVARVATTTLILIAFALPTQAHAASRASATPVGICSSSGLKRRTR